MVGLIPGPMDEIDASTALTVEMTLSETIRHLVATERTARSRFRFGSPCRFVRTVDILVHIVLPELLEDRAPRLTERLRHSSPRWGRSWREW